MDDDCDGTLDDGLTQTTFYRDADGDGYGAAAVTIQACAVPTGYVANSADCNDANAAIKPGAADAICDGIDQNCNGTADDGFVSPPNGWIATPLTGAPSARRYPTMVSTGDRVIVWGGQGVATNLGGVYRPRDAATDAWTPTSLTNAPTARYFHTAVWTGTEMIVWGGGVNTGGRYNPDTNVWTATSTTGAPIARQQHTAVWTSSTMIVWGGTGFNTGGIYTPGPGAGSWVALPTAGAPTGRSGHTAVWTGTQMIVWGGFTTVQLNSGGLYDSTGWHAIAGSPLVGRSRHTAVWTGSEMIIWGGYDGTSSLSDGASYNPQSNVWTALPAGPPGRYSHTAIWDPVDGRMVVWGGFGFTAQNDAWAYDPVARTWTALPTTGAPVGRLDHAAAWLGSTREMVVWGGATPAVLNTGGRIVVAPFDCGVGECSRESGYTCTAGQLGYGACTPGAPVTEVCNGLDDDCDGTIDNGNPAPSEQPAVSLSKQAGAANVHWPTVGGATGYDVVRGNLLALRSSGGDFSISTTDCLAHETVDLFALDTSVPAPGDGTWQLVRANACGAKGSYGSSSTDAGITASGLDCPP